MKLTVQRWHTRFILPGGFLDHTVTLLHQYIRHKGTAVPFGTKKRYIAFD